MRQLYYRAFAARTAHGRLGCPSPDRPLLADQTRVNLAMAGLRSASGSLEPERLPALQTGDCAPEQHDAAASKQPAWSSWRVRFGRTEGRVPGMSQGQHCDSPPLAVLPMLVDTALWAIAQWEIRDNSSH